MAIDNNIKHFTAADIEKYHKGLLSNKEMHDLEKAAMDDPFLADALEGYAVAGVNAATNIAELKKRLGDKTEGAKIISMNAAPRNNFKILRAAVLIAFIAGASLLIYQFGFNKNSGEIAQAEPTKKEEVKSTDTAKAGTTPGTVPTPVSETKPVADAKAVPAKIETAITSTDKETESVGNANNGKSGEAAITTEKTTTDDVVVNKPGLTPSVTTTPEKVADESNWYKADTKPAEKKEIARRDAADKNKLKSNNQELDKDGVKDQVAQQNRSATATRQAEDQKYRNQNQVTNLFRGRVTDVDNNGVPFANVTNVQDNNAGTYTDAKGYFNLTYPDSVLTVQVRSIGFENNNVQLRNAVPNNQVVLQDDRKTLSEVVLSKQKPNATARSRDGNMKLEEPEPADGWGNYYTYLTNNLEVPADLKDKQTGSNEVQVSFEVDKNGEPTSIKVEKSLCAKCDQEAIRLVKEGPKWKRKVKKGRTTVTIYF
jgi:CarboxypepD_reg-like domain/Gram-negative bacterial TonB protein C-terminal